MTILISSLQKKVGSEPLISVWHPPPGPQTNLSPRPHSELKELRKAAGPTGCFEGFPLPSNSPFDLLPAGAGPLPLGGLCSARWGAERKAVICVVTSTHFSIGAGERSDALGFSDAL